MLASIDFLEKASSKPDGAKSMTICQVITLLACSVQSQDHFTRDFVELVAQLQYLVTQREDGFDRPILAPKVQIWVDPAEPLRAEEARLESVCHAVQMSTKSGQELLLQRVKTFTLFLST